MEIFDVIGYIIFHIKVALYISFNFYFSRINWEIKSVNVLILVLITAMVLLIAHIYRVHFKNR